MPYHDIEDPTRLRRILDATLLIESNLELPVVLRHVIEEARVMTGARYGALGVLDDSKTALSEFITVGLAADEEELIGARPTGQGVLGLLLAHPESLRIRRLGDHPDSFGFPAGHPPMTSFLGVPIRVRGEVYGNLYLTDKEGWSEFTADDQALVGALAVAAGIAIENASLHRRVQEMAVYDERERFARDLHDTVIQRLFAAGLTLQSIAGAAQAADVSARLTAVVTEIDESIQYLRSTIYELGLSGGEIGVRARILQLLRDLDVALGFEVQSSFEGPVDTALSDRVAEHLLATAREAVTNIGRHAGATSASLTLRVHEDQCELVITDNGRGLGGTGTRGGGMGLVNLRRRAEKLRGELAVVGAPGGGTVLVWRVPLATSD